MQQWLSTAAYEQRKKEIKCDKSLNDFEQMQKIFELENLKDFRVNENAREIDDDLNYKKDYTPLSVVEILVLIFVLPLALPFLIFLKESE